MLKPVFEEGEEIVGYIGGRKHSVDRQFERCFYTTDNTLGSVPHQFVVGIFAIIAPMYQFATFYAESSH